MARDLTTREFEARYRELVRKLGEGGENEGCVECVDCRGCSLSTFCRGSERLARCHYCVDCALCSDCGHCRDCRGLVGCQHCLDCDNCLSSSYLVRCTAMSRCTYCFGCVGLDGRDFYILNEPYDRSDYFAITQRLARDLGL